MKSFSGKGENAPIYLESFGGMFCRKKFCGKRKKKGGRDRLYCPISLHFRPGEEKRRESLGGGDGSPFKSNFPLREKKWLFVWAQGGRKVSEFLLPSRNSMGKGGGKVSHGGKGKGKGVEPQTSLPEKEGGGKAGKRALPLASGKKEERGERDDPGMSGREKRCAPSFIFAEKRKEPIFLRSLEGEGKYLLFRAIVRGEGGGATFGEQGKGEEGKLGHIH